MSTVRSFVRSVDSLARIFEFSAEAFARHGIDPGLLPSVDFVLEELFTNMIKYSRGDADVQIELRPLAGGVEATLADRGAEPFDVTQAPAVDTTLPIEQRRPGGLGLHLIRRMVDSIEYEYRQEDRQSRITFRKTAPITAPGAQVAPLGEDDADD